VTDVCSKCFQDKIARRFIRQHGSVGDCDYCDSTQLKVLPAYRLRDLFEEVLGLYERYEPAPGFESWGSQSLAECLQEWEIFNEDRQEKVQNDILDEILGSDPRDGDISASDDWQAKSDHWAATPTHQRWPWFANYLKTTRRFIIEDDPTGDLIPPEKWVPHLLKAAHAVSEIKTSKKLFRGRMGTVMGESPKAYSHPLPAKDMGAPPAKFARASRANPEGISFLYCAFEAETAIVETGRFPGAVVSLRELRVREPLRLANLRGDRSIIEPLGTSNLAEKVETTTLLGSLGRALAEPIHPDDSALEYVPTQYLAEIIRASGYDGICFQSGLYPNGTNVVIFDPTNVRITRRAWVFELGRAEYTIHPNPKFIIKRVRRIRNALQSISSSTLSST
jgi:hypothetical protein